MISFRRQINTVDPNDLAIQMHWRRWEQARETSKRADARLERLRRLHLRDNSPVLLRAGAEARAAHLAEGKEFRFAALSQEPWGTQSHTDLTSLKLAKLHERILLNFILPTTRPTP